VAHENLEAPEERNPRRVELQLHGWVYSGKLVHGVPLIGNYGLKQATYTFFCVQCSCLDIQLPSNVNVALIAAAANWTARSGVFQWFRFNAVRLRLHV